MKRTFCLLFLCLGSFILNAQDILVKKKINEIDSLLYAHLGRIALPKIDSLLITSVPENTKLYLKANKVEALVHLEDYENALPFANELLKSPKLKGKALMKTRIERSLLYEVSGKTKESKRDLDFVGNYYNNTKVKKDEFYGEYLYRLSSWLRGQKEINKSIIFAEEAVEFGNKNNYLNVKATGLILLAITKYSKQVNKKEELFKLALNLWKKCNNHIHINFMYESIARCYVTNKKNAIAHKYLDSAIVTAKKIKYYNSLSSSYRFKSYIYEQEKDYKKALEHFKNHQAATEKDILNKQRVEVQKIETKYNFKKAEQLSKEIESKRKNTFYLLILICVILGLTIVALRVTKQKNKRIKATEQEVSQKLKEKEFLLRELNHRVKNNLALILSLVKFQYYEIKEPTYKEKFKSLENRIHTIAAAHEQLLYDSNNLEEDEFDANEYLSKIANALIQISPHKVILNLNTNNIKLNIDTMLPIGILINELMSNSLKHAAFKEVLIIDVQVSLQKSNISIIYKDSGSTFKENKNTKSLGISIINSMVKQLKGTIEREKSEYNIILQLKK